MQQAVHELEMNQDQAPNWTAATAVGHRGAGDSLAFRYVVGDAAPQDELLAIICERIQVAAKHLGLTREDLLHIFGPYSLFEAEATARVDGREEKFLIVEAHHLIQGKVGKGALKIVLPRDLVRESKVFLEAAPRGAEVIPPAPRTRWDSADEAWGAVKHFLRELMTGETLSMSLKSQATDAPFAGSEGIILCAAPEYDEPSGRFFLRPVLMGNEAGKARDKELVESIMNSTAELLTRAGRIAHDRIVHAAETNSTMTSRLNLQLPSNVVEGHLRTLLREDAHIVIGDEDMTARLRRILARPGYRPTECALAREAARMQLAHSILALDARERLRNVLAGLPPAGPPSPEQFREMVGIFFGSGETQQTEDQIFHHREPILRALSAALSAGRLDECEDPLVLSLYLRILLDNPVKMMKTALLRKIPAEEALPADWNEQFPLLPPKIETALEALMPSGEAGKSDVKRSFARILDLLTTWRDTVSGQAEERYASARIEVLGRAIQAITAAGGIIPSVERIRFFVSPFTYECVTPKLGVVTRKPLEVCGSELRPEAMAAGAVYALEVLLRGQAASRSKPLAGLTVAIQGLGNAGKGVARMARERGAKIVAASDSRGAVIAPAGLSDQELAALIDHKSAGKRLDTFTWPDRAGAAAATAGSRLILHKDPEALMTVKADILVLTAKAASVHEGNVAGLRCRIVCELTGAAVTGRAKDELRERSISVIPDNVGSSGGLLVSLSEMLQNSYGQQWERSLEETALRQQIEQSHDAILKVVKKHGVDLATASDILALRRMAALAIYRKNLETAARQMQEQIQAIGDTETVLVVSDDDDDGVASAAILRGLIARLNPGREQQIQFVNESLRSRAVLDLIESKDRAGGRVNQVFVLDRSFPLSASGQQVAADIARRCRVLMVNNHELPERLVGGESRGVGREKGGGQKSPAELGVVLISPQTLKATSSSRNCTTALVLREIAHQLVADPALLNQMDWQAAIGSCLDVSPETTKEWLLFYAQFNPDQMMEAARALRMVTRAQGFQPAIRALQGVERPDQLETNKSWEEFLSAYRLLADRVQLLVEKIVMENVGRPYVAHLFTPTEVASPLSQPGDETRCLDLYPWISEQLTQRGDFAEKPIIVGQVIRDVLQRASLGVRIRSPRHVELMEVGLPEHFQTGGLPNTAVARIPLADSVPPEQQFQTLVDNIWWKTVSPTIKLNKLRTEP